MAVLFVVGACGTGKSTYIYEDMIGKSMEDSSKATLFLLPEQDNLSAEQQMVKRHPKGGTMDISILSFSRLAFMVFDELGYSVKDVLDDYGKCMMLMKVLKAHQDELTYYKGMVGKSGFVEEMKSTISEMYQYQISPDKLDAIIGKLDEKQSLYYKLQDIRLLLQAFEDSMSSDYVIAEQILTLLKEVMPESSLFSGARIYLDGFTGFTPAQYDVIEVFLQMGCELTITVACDESVLNDNQYGEMELFSEARGMYNHICTLAHKHQVRVLPHVECNVNYRLRNNKELMHLSNQLFRYPGKAYKEPVCNLSISRLEDGYEQAQYVASIIKDLVIHQGYRYSDIAVVMNHVLDGISIWKYSMEQCEIPYFIDGNSPMLNNPILVVLQLLFELFRTDFSYNSVFALLKCGFFRLDLERVYALENYVLKRGIRGYSMWAKSFRGGTKGLHTINETRAAFMKLLEPWVSLFTQKRAAGKEYVRALYDFFVEHKLPERLQDMSKALEEDNHIQEALVYAQIYEKWLELLDKTYAVLGEEIIDRDAFFGIVMTGLMQIQLGSIPATLDQVVIGDLERSRLHEVKILFVVNVNEGIVPSPKPSTGILLDRDRSSLRDMEVTLAPDSREDLVRQQYNFYRCVSMATEKIYITYKGMDEKGKALMPSYYIGQIKNLFPQLITGNVDFNERVGTPMTKGQLVADFARMLKEEDFRDASVYEVMKQQQPWLVSRIMDGYYYNNQAANLERSIVKQLYGNTMVHSVSRLETYANCAYQFFLRYGLKLKKREEYQVETTDVGIILHGVMEEFFQTIRNDNLKPDCIDAEKRDQMVEALTIKWAKEQKDTLFQENFRNRHQLEVLVRIAKRSVANLCRHLQQGNMMPTYFEKSFSSQDNLSYIQMALEDDMRMELKGVVDRVDIKETEDSVYVKIIDYKSGAKNVDFLKMIEGKQLQLTVYMNVMLELLHQQYPGKQIVPTGMYYYQMNDPIVEGDGEDEIESERIMASRLTGLVNDSEICRELMDGQSGSVTPVLYKKDGTLYSRNQSLVSTKELEQISSFVREKMIEIGNDIVHGQIVMNPEKGENSNPCKNCEYKSICRFEPGLGGNEYRLHPQMNRQEARDYVLGKDQKGEGGEQV